MRKPLTVYSPGLTGNSIGGRKVEHLKQNIQSLTFSLTDEHIKTIEEATPFDVGFPSNFVGADPAVTGGDSFVRLLRARDQS